MGRMREHPRYNVISMRVSEEERELLYALMERTHKSMSDLMREAMENFSNHFEDTELDQTVAQP